MKFRVTAYIKEGLDHPSCRSSSSLDRDVPLYKFQKMVGKTLSPLMASFKLNFNNSHIVTYFVNRSVHDGLPADDFKTINKSAEYLFCCRRVQSIQY